MLNRYTTGPFDRRFRRGTCIRVYDLEVFVSRKTRRLAGSFDCPPSFPPQRESRATLITFSRHSPRSGNPEPLWLSSPATLPAAGIRSHFGYLPPSLSPQRESRATLVTFLPSLSPQRESGATLVTFPRHSPRIGNPEPLWLPSPVFLAAAGIQSPRHAPGRLCQPGPRWVDWPTSHLDRSSRPPSVGKEKCLWIPSAARD